MSYQYLRLQRTAATILLTVLMQYSGIMLSLQSATLLPVSFAAGSAVALFFLRGMRAWPGIIIGTWLACTLVKLDATTTTVLTLYYGALPLVIYQLNQHFFYPTLLFTNCRQFLYWLGITSIITAVFGVFLHNFFEHPRFFFVSEFLGILVYGYGFILWDAYVEQLYSLTKTARTKLIATLIALAVTTITGYTASFVYAYTFLGFALAIMLLLGYLLANFNWLGLVLACTIMALVLNFADYFWLPIFIAQPTRALAMAQAIVFICCLVCNVILYCSISNIKTSATS